MVPMVLNNAVISNNSISLPRSQMTFKIRGLMLASSKKVSVSTNTWDLNALFSPKFGIYPIYIFIVEASVGGEEELLKEKQHGFTCEIYFFTYTMKILSLRQILRDYYLPFQRPFSRQVI